MKTKSIMIASSFFLGVAGLFALFAPEELLKLLSLPQTNPLPVMIQLMGTLYLSFALMNWTVKDNIIGGVYLRPISLANFAHFMMGGAQPDEISIIKFNQWVSLGCVDSVYYFCCYLYMACFLSYGYREQTQSAIVCL